jgi:hypothetical protein
LGIALALSLIGGGSAEAANPYVPGSTGYDVSYPQCSSRLPRGGAFGIVGVTNGLPWSANPCLSAQYKWAASLSKPPAFYANTANPGPISSRWKFSGPKSCASFTSYNDLGCSYNYGWNAAEQAFNVAVSATSTAVASGSDWWLDVETVNSWNGDKAANSATIQGYIDYFKSRGVGSVGVYSTAYQWKLITGGYSLPTTPNWVAGASSASSAARLCGNSFTGGPVYLVQYRRSGFDANYACGATGSSSVRRG